MLHSGAVCYWKTYRGFASVANHVNLFYGGLETEVYTRSNTDNYIFLVFLFSVLSKRPSADASYSLLIVYFFLIAII